MYLEMLVDSGDGEDEDLHKCVGEAHHGDYENIHAQRETDDEHVELH